MKNERRGEGPVGASWSRPRPARYRSRLGIALALSLCFHAFILSLQFGAAGFGLPALAWPWAERRVQALTVRLAEVQRPPAPDPAPVPPAVVPRVPPATVTAEPPERVQPLPADKSFEVTPPRAARAVPPSEPLSLPRRETAEPAPAAETRARQREIRPKPQPEILAQSDPQQETFNVPSPGPVEPEQQRAPEGAARKQAEEPPLAAQETEQAEEDRRRKAEGERRKEEARKQEEARTRAEEATRQQAEATARERVEEDARQRTEEGARQRTEEGARQRALALQKELEAKKQEERRLEDEKKQEEARRRALELEARRRAEEIERQKTEELARQRALAQQKEQEAKRLEEARRIEDTREQDEARRQEEARRIAVEAEALRRAEEAARQQAAAAAAGGGTPADAPPAPGALSGKDIAAKALGQLGTPGAARTDPPRQPSQPGSAGGLRRGSVLGSERDVTARMYADSWRLKIERAAPINFPAWAHRKARDYPIVTVAIRSDGSVEDVIIHRSSGLRELDEAVRRMVRLYAPFSAFPPSLARQYDVIDIRRVWYFDGALRILDEL